MSVVRVRSTDLPLLRYTTVSTSSGPPAVRLRRDKSTPRLPPSAEDALGFDISCLGKSKARDCCRDGEVRLPSAESMLLEHEEATYNELIAIGDADGTVLRVPLRRLTAALPEKALHRRVSGDGASRDRLELDKRNLSSPG